jgi:hypothetical protein
VFEQECHDSSQHRLLWSFAAAPNSPLLPQVYLPFMSPSLDRQKLEQETVLPSIFLEVQRVLQQQVAACGAGSGATLQSLGLATTFGESLKPCAWAVPCFMCML